MSQRSIYMEEISSETDSSEDIPTSCSIPQITWHCMHCGHFNSTSIKICSKCKERRDEEKKIRKGKKRTTGKKQDKQHTKKNTSKTKDGKKKSTKIQNNKTESSKNVRKSSKKKVGKGGKGSKSQSKSNSQNKSGKIKNREVKAFEKSMRSSSLSGHKGGRGEVSVNLKWSEIKTHEKVGAGRYGMVYRGECRGHPVAVKVLDPTKLLKEKLEQLATEVGIMASIRHPCVTLFMGVCTDDIEHVALVMEFVEGNSLDHLLKESPGTLPQRLRIAKDVAAGVNWLHHLEPPILHRDLKPANILIDNYKGSNWRVKVCDFGLSCFKTYNVPENEDEIELAETAVGTPIWMAPEVLEGYPNTEKSDVYAFGIILWQLLTLLEPWADETSYSIFLDRLIEDKKRPPIPSGTLPTMRKLIEDCWAPEPKDRPSFDDIIPRIDDVYIDTAISDKIGRKIWRKIGKKIDRNEELYNSSSMDSTGKNYPVKVPYDIFYSAFKEMVPGIKGEDTIPDEMIQLVLLPFLPNLEDSSFSSDNGKEVTAEKWGNFLVSFGPLGGMKTPFINRVFDLCHREWFHGNVSKEIAEQRLLIMKKKGMFLVRLSTTGGPGTFAISRLATVDKVHHYRVHRTSRGAFEISLSNQTMRFASLIDLVESKTNGLKRQLKLKYPCPGSTLLASRAIGHYISTSVDDEVKKLCT